MCVSIRPYWAVGPGILLSSRHLGTKEAPVRHGPQELLASDTRVLSIEL